MASQSTLAFATKIDVPLLDPTGDFSGPRAPGSFLPVKDVWIPYYWFLCQTSHITCLNGFNDRGTPAGREPDIKNVHHIDGSKPFLEACKQPFLFGFPWLFPSPIWTTLLSSANHLHQPTRSSSKLHRLARSMPRSRVKHFSVDGVEPEERQEQWFSLRIIEDLARMMQYMPKQRGNCLGQMESKHYHQVLCKLPDKVQLQVRIGVSHIDFIAAPFK